MTILVTGGAGFIGANFVLDWLRLGGETVVNLDKLTYAGNLGNLVSLEGDARHIFVQGDIGDAALVGRLLTEHRPRAVINFAAESHVDRSIHGAAGGTFGSMHSFVTPANAGVQQRPSRRSPPYWIPAFAGMTGW